MIKQFLLVSLSFILLILPCKAASKLNIHLTDEGARKFVISKLKDKNIPFHIELLDNDKNGYIVWGKKDDVRVREIIHEATRNECNSSDRTSITLLNDVQNEYLAALLTEEDIPFTIIENTDEGGPKNAIEYDRSDEQKVRELYIRVLKEKPFFKK